MSDHPAPDELERIFDERLTDELALLAKLPETADLKKFRSGLIACAGIFLEYLDRSPVLVRREIAALNKLARRQTVSADHRELALLQRRLSPGTQEKLTDNWRLWKAQEHQVGPIPETPTTFTLEETLEITEHCYRLKPGRRRRPGGERSRRTVEWLLWAPRAVPYRPRNHAVRLFIGFLRCVYLQATGKVPARTANRERPSPFVKLAQACLRRLGAEGRQASVTDIINAMARNTA
jgi:hypothetical protein